ncbi:MAG: phosphoribosylformylglycinamidine cyclo-ligase [Phycisphaerae bacterium]|nr:phosphoribosylformylglycinamidine cyclo-ligase [Phycisphaerae bacterium]
MARGKTTYKQAGVDIEAGDRMVDLIGPLVRRTYGPRVVGGHGAFAGMLRLDYNERIFRRNYRNPVLVACTDGVGTKVLVAIQAGRLRTVGIDLVAMSVNDMLTCEAEPLLFLDYLAVNKLDPERAAEIVTGIVAGCEQADCVLLGGETAEMPDLYRKDDFDLAGFAVGVVELKRLKMTQAAEPGDVIIGLASSGIHSNGYSLVRRLVFDQAGMKVGDHVPALGMTVSEALLEPTRIYVRSIIDLIRAYKRKRPIRGMAHITGGGLPGNVPRCLPKGVHAAIKLGSWPIPPVFPFLQSLGVDDKEMYRVFNMGIGYTLIVRPAFASAAIRRLERAGEQAYVIGNIRRGGSGVRFI